MTGLDGQKSTTIQWCLCHLKVKDGRYEWTPYQIELNIGSLLICYLLQDNQVVFYNRVPKSGSTTLMGVVYGLARQNRFHCLHVNVSKNDHYMSASDQVSLCPGDCCTGN